METYRITIEFDVETENLTKWKRNLADLIINNDKECLFYNIIKEEEIR